MNTVTRIFLGCLCALFLMPGGALAQTNRFFPYAWESATLSNGLRVVTVPTEHKGLVALQIILQVGSRHEVDPGKSGFAHFFEHMMFRGSERFSAAHRQEIFTRAGAESNAYTTDDRTVYHAFFAREDLSRILEVEADRFLRLVYTEDEFKTEARAVLGEYNKSSSDPAQKLFEILRDRAFARHPYKHTTMGFVQDIEDMPNQFTYSTQFYRRFYRPERTTILLVGDVDQAGAMELAGRYFGEWERGGEKVEIPQEPPPKGPKNALIDWPANSLPYVAVAYHGPAFSETAKDKVSLDLMKLMAFGENSELYRRLVLREQRVDSLTTMFEDRRDPELFIVFARLKTVRDVDHVRDAIIATFNKFSKEPVAPGVIDQSRSRLTYSAAMGWESPKNIAHFLAPYLALRPTPEAVQRLFEAYGRVTPQDVVEVASRYFTDERRIVVTLTPRPPIATEVAP